MVTPKQSQRIIKWCVESALTLLIDFFSSHTGKFGQHELAEYLNQELEGSGISRRSISRMSYELKRQKYLEIFEGDSVRLTDKAKIKVIDKFIGFNKQDGKKRLISFDIPETKKRQRNGFRRTIKRMGFRQIQKSLWVCNKNVGDLVEIAAREFEVEEYVAYFVVETSNIDKYISKLLSKTKTVQ